MQSAMNICVVVFIKIPQRLNDSARFLRSRSAIEINKGMPVRLLAQNRKVPAKDSAIQTLVGNVVHPLICYTRRQAPPYSQCAAKS